MRKAAIIIANKYPYPTDDGKKVVLKGVLRYLAERFGAERVAYIVVARRPPELHQDLPCETFWVEPPSTLVKLWNVLWWCFLRRRKTVQQAMLHSPRVRRALFGKVRELEPHLLFLDMLRIGQFFAHRPLPDTRQVLFIDELLSLRLENILQIEKLYPNIKPNALGTFGDFIPRYLHGPLQRPALYRFLFRFEAKLTETLETEALSEFDLCLLLNANEAKRLRATSKAGALKSMKPLVVFQNRRPRDFRGDPTFILLGTLSNTVHRASVLVFLETQLEAVVARIPHGRLRIIGTGANEEVRAAARRYPEHVSIEGFVSDLDEVLATGCALLAPLVCGGGFKLKILSALHHGLPVLTTPSGVDGLTMTGGCLIEEDLTRFPERMVSLLDRDFNESLSQRARRTFEEHFSESVILSEYEELLGEVLPAAFRETNSEERNV